MIEVQSIFTLPFLQTLGWALPHFIWQGVAGAILLAGMLFVLSGYSASIRYGIALSAMLLMPVLFAVTTWKICISLQEVAVYSQSISPMESIRSVDTSILETEPSEIQHNGEATITHLTTPVIAESSRFSVRLNEWVVSRL